MHASARNSRWGGRCYVLDERVVGENPMIFLMPAEIERVDYLFDGQMVRIYSRRYLATIVSDQPDLAKPSFTPVPKGLLSGGILAGCS